jgi:hypothetical protein
MKLKKEHFIGIAGVVGIVYYVFFCKKGDDSTPTGEEPSSGGGGGFGGGGFPTGALTTDTPKPPAKEEVKPIKNVFASFLSRFSGLKKK